MPNFKWNRGVLLYIDTEEWNRRVLLYTEVLILLQGTEIEELKLEM